MAQGRPPWERQSQQDDRPRKRKINEACLKERLLLGRCFEDTGCRSLIFPLKTRVGAQLTRLLQPKREEG